MSQMPQILHSHNFNSFLRIIVMIFVNDFASRNEFQGLNFHGMHVICENSKMYVPRKFVRVYGTYNYCVKVLA